MQEFYSLINDGGKSQASIGLENSMYEDMGLANGFWVPPKDWTFQILHGKKLYDYIIFSDAINHAISAKFYNLLLESKLLGWHAHPIRIEGSKEQFYVLIVNGRCGPLIEPKVKGFYKCVTFDEASWDGSDFFRPTGTYFTFCTERVAEILKKNKLSNVKIKTLKDMELYSKGE